MTPATDNFNAFEYVAFDLSNSNIKVIAGQLYTIQLTTSIAQTAFLIFNNSNVYANGQASNDPDWDYLFKTNVKAFSTDSYLPLSGGALTGNLSTSGTLTAGAVTFPNTHGTSGQVLTSTGSGNLTWTTPSSGSGGTHTIGELYGGGMVFYVTADGLHGLIAETVDQSSNSIWYNAQDIISTSSRHSSAGALFTDWRLPTKNELSLMYRNIGQGAPSPYTNNGGFQSGLYLSSTEVDTYFVWGIYFYDGVVSHADKEYPLVSVRAIRAF
jgi:hypothetical protein